MTDDLVIDVGDLVGHLEATRAFSGRRHASLRVGDSLVDGAVQASGVVRGTVDGVIARFEAHANVHMSCARCLTEWDDMLAITGEQHFGKVADENGYVISSRTVDVGGPAIDEVALAMSATPVCSKDCRGLCPTCGTDLNSDPCDGHGEDSESPFAALKDLFDS